MIISRRNFVASGLAMAGAVATASPLLSAPGGCFGNLVDSFARLEKDSNGRLGVAVLDTRSGDSIGYRKDERFAMCSTFKMLLAGAVLKRVDAGKEKLDRTIAIGATGFLPNSPVSQEHAGGSMTIRELCAAIVTRSDNTAANLLLASIGGPPGITRFARSLGDPVTRLDRVETGLNEALPGDPRDTTSPAAMAGNMRGLLVGNALSPVSQEQLIAWLIANKTGDERIRAGLRSGWRVGDKTGSNGDNTTNDVAIIWPGHRGPVLVAAYLTMCAGPESKRNAVLAEVGREVAKCIESS
jgi:beta-lactamase class A